MSLRASTRFAHFQSDEDLIIVAGMQEEADCDLALAYGLTLCKARRLVLVLPRAFAFATLQRSAFLRRDTQPTVWVHDCGAGGDGQEKLEQVRVYSTHVAEGRLKEKIEPKSPAQELYLASTAAHLGDRSSRVAALVEWATEHPDLDPGHRRGERAWHCMGQRVLTIRGTKGKGLEVRAGIHYSSGPNAIEPHPLGKGDSLTAAGLADIEAKVSAGINARLAGDFFKADEHWLQAVIRRRPEIVGVEQPALREVPAWRPAGEGEWGRGYIDLLGVDGQGDLRIAETKLAANTDDRLIFQGLDYYIWCRVYEQALTQRLGIPRRAEFVMHYVIGETPATGDHHVSSYSAAQAKALTLPWRFQIVRRWFPKKPGDTVKATGELLPEGQLPKGNVKAGTLS